MENPFKKKKGEKKKKPTNKTEERSIYKFPSTSELLNPTLFLLSLSQNHIKSLRVKGTSGDHLLQPPPKAGPPRAGYKGTCAGGFPPTRPMHLLESLLSYKLPDSAPCMNGHGGFPAQPAAAHLRGGPSAQKPPPRSQHGCPAMPTAGGPAPLVPH